MDRSIQGAMVRRWRCLAGLALVLRASSAWAAAPTPLEIAAQPAVKISVTGEGWYRVTEPQLRAAGLPAGTSVDGLQLFSDGAEHALQLRGNGDDVLDPDEAIEFYGQGRDTLWTGTRTYWLRPGVAGARAPYVVHPRGPAAPASFASTVTLRERLRYYASLRNGEATNILGATIDSKGTTQTLVLGAVADPGTAVLRVTLQGVSAGLHVVAVTFGGVPLGACELSGLERSSCDFDVPAVAQGPNAVGLVAMGTAPDISVVESLQLTYEHAFVAEGDRLALVVPPKRRVAVAGFSTPNVRVVDVTDPRAPIELVVSPSVNVGGSAGAPPGSWTIAFDVQDADADRSLIAFTEAGVLAPAAVAASRPSDWMQPREGELVILSHARFLDAVRPLADRRAAEGWSVALVDLQDVYDEFGSGDKSALAIRDFLEGAAARWTVPPRHVLLVGDATFDPRNLTGRGDLDFAPTKLVDARDMETSSDDWFVDRDRDGLPDLSIGRLPVRTTVEAKIVVDKILGYAGKADLSRGGLFVAAPSADGLAFEEASAISATTVADLMPVETYGAAAGPAGLQAKLRAGPFLVNYLGHGSVEVWEGLLARADAAALDNQHLSIYVAMNCLNGFFHDLYTTSLAEALLLAPGGAVAVWASSTLTPFEPQAEMNKAFLARLSRTSLGQAALEAKRTITDVDARRTWMLFGDPTLFGTPGPPPTPDAGPDAVPPDADAPDATLSPDGGTDASLDLVDGADAQGPTDASPNVVDGTDTAGPADASTDARKPQTSGGCSCRTAPGGELTLGLLLLSLAVVVSRSRETPRRQGRRARRAG